MHEERKSHTSSTPTPMGTEESPGCKRTENLQFDVKYRCNSSMLIRENNKNTTNKYNDPSKTNISNHNIQSQDENIQYSLDNSMKEIVPSGLPRLQTRIAVKELAGELSIRCKLDPDVKLNTTRAAFDFNQQLIIIGYERLITIGFDHLPPEFQHNLSLNESSTSAENCVYDLTTYVEHRYRINTQAFNLYGTRVRQKSFLMYINIPAYYFHQYDSKQKPIVTTTHLEDYGISGNQVLEQYADQTQAEIPRLLLSDQSLDI